MYQVGSGTGLSYTQEKVNGYQVLRNVDCAFFPGGAIFIGGAGGFFEGTPSEILTAVRIVDERIPKHAKMFPGHDNAVDELKYSLFLDSENKGIQKKIAWA